MSATAVRQTTELEAHRDTVRAVVLAYEQGYDAGYYDESGPAPFGFGTLQAVAWAEGWMRGATDAAEDACEGEPAAVEGEEEGEL